MVSWRTIGVTVSGVVFVLMALGTSWASDSGITTDVKTKFQHDSQLKGASIDVETHSGVVSLSGQASPEQFRIAEMIAGTVAGVKAVLPPDPTKPLESAPSAPPMERPDQFTEPSGPMSPSGRMNPSPTAPDR